MEAKEDVKRPIHWTKQMLQVKNLGVGKLTPNAFWNKTIKELDVEIKKK